MPIDRESTEEPDHSVNGVRRTAFARCGRPAVLGAAGLLSLLGLGATLAYRVNEDPGAVPADTTVAEVLGHPSPNEAARPSSVDERVAAIRSAAAKAGPGVLRPLPSVSAGAVTTTTTAQDGGRLKVVSAPEDLTGHGELGWVAGAGKKVGNALCSNTIRLSVDARATTHPTLLICWRTSARKSVYTLAVRTGGRPSAKTSVAAIDAQWARLS